MPTARRTIAKTITAAITSRSASLSSFVAVCDFEGDDGDEGCAAKEEGGTRS